MGKKLYYSTCSVLAPHIGITIDDVLLRKSEGDEVYWCYCHNALCSCMGNLNSYPSICKFCQFMYRRYKSMYGKGVRMIPIDKRNFTHKSHSWCMDNFDQIKSIVYRDVYLGYSVLSVYLTFSRDLDVEKSEEFKKYFTPIISDLCDFVDYIYDLVAQIEPDEIISFNGRTFENRLFYDISKALGIKYTALEAVGGNGEPIKKVRYEGGLPHSIIINTNKINELWEMSSLSYEKKAEIASSFYTRRRNGILVADPTVYISNQVTGLLPKDFNPKQRNIAIFNSSDDETVALGEEWDDTIFSTQFEAIEFILQHSSPVLHYYLRIHPHLKGVKYQAHMVLYTLSKYKNITIIPPESEISTYALMDACEKVITFGSTMGVESVFWGKPSILLRRSLYESLNVSYQPSCKEDIIPLLEEKLEPKPILGTLKYAYFLLDRDYRIDKNMIELNVKYKHFFWNFPLSPYLKICGSHILYQIGYFICCIVLPKFFKNRLNFPGM